MFWSDTIAKEIVKRKLALEWVDDMKTPSGRIHVGALRGVVVHDLIYKSLLELGQKAKYTYVFENHDPMDALPVYLPKEKFEKYLGMPLFAVPSPEKGFANYAEFYAKEFKRVFNSIGSNPEIIWTKDLYTSGKMNEAIRKSLDNTAEIKKIYEKIYKKKLPDNWYPFQPYCSNCGKVSTTTVINWDGKEIKFVCEINKVKFTKGCGYDGKMSPFGGEGKIVGKLPWKVEWAAKWQAIGVTVEGAGKDHMSAGGSHDIASLVAEKVLKYPVPYPFAYEWFILGKKKMSTSKGVGISAIGMLEIIPPQILRFLMVKTKINSEINFDISNPNLIPFLFDEYQKASDAYFQKGDKDLARIFELSQIGKIQKPPKIRFAVLAQWVQMPNMEKEIEREGLLMWKNYAKNWVEKYAPETEKILIQKKLPESASNLSLKQKELLKKIISELDRSWEAEKFQFEIYEMGKTLGLNGKDTFAAIYRILIGKDHGPKAAWLILSLDKEFVVKRFEEAISEKENQRKNEIGNSGKKFSLFKNKEIFSISQEVKNKFNSISVGVAVINGVSILSRDSGFDREKNQFISSLKNLTTEQIGEYQEIKSYRRLYKEMGIDWHSRKPSPEALLRRIALGKNLYTVNTCVDSYNLIVMKNRVSVGVFDYDKIKFPTVLRYAKKGEEILLLGDSQPTKYFEKEIAYFDANGGYNLDFNYRDAQRTAVTIDTKNIILNVDGIYDISPEQVEKTLKESCDIIIKYCGGTVETFGIALE